MRLLETTQKFHISHLEEQVDNQMEIQKSIHATNFYKKMPKGYCAIQKNV